jgi:hypothetical protein
MDIKKFLKFQPLIFTGLILLLIFVGGIQIFINSYAMTGTKIPVYMISTKGISNYTGIEGKGYGDYAFLDIANLIKLCPPEVVIFVHGWGDDEYKSKERLDRVKLSLEYNKYNTTLIGLSWDPNIIWPVAQNEAKENGPKLAQFIVDLKSNCKNTDIRLLAHSLGSRLVLSSLESLHNNTIWKSNGFKITSVNLLGAAVDDEEVSKNLQDVISDRTNNVTLKFAYGNSIEDEVKRFYNMYDSQDNALQPHPFAPFDKNYGIYPIAENDNALGQVPYQMLPNITLPNNFIPINVTSEIKAIHDSDLLEGWDLGLCNIEGYCKVDIGDNHGGYIGYRNPDDNNSILDDGAMNVVVENWNTK